MSTLNATLIKRSLVTASASVALFGFLSPPVAAAEAQAPADAGTGWYLALGDSLATGYQPGRGEDRAGGYVGTVLEHLQVGQPKTKLVNLACYGESTVTMLDGTHCAGVYEEGSQLAQAVEFLHAHARTTRLVTVTLGSNDITPCLAKQDVNGCAQERLAVIYRNMETILGELHSTAPQVPIVVTNYYNPYLALHFDPSRRALVPLTTALQAQLNATLAAASVGEGQVADVATAFRSYDTTVTAQGLPVNVATICVYTWMCSWSPSNIHATSLGYDAMAQAVIDRH